MAEGDDLTVACGDGQDVLACRSALEEAGLRRSYSTCAGFFPGPRAGARSVRQTGLLVVVHEANRTGGFGAEVVAGWPRRSAPSSMPSRGSARKTRVPASPHLLRGVQETYARVLQKPRMLRSDDDLGYLLRVLRNTYFSRLRAAARRQRTDALPDELDRVVDLSASAPDAALDASELYRMIAELPDPFREALVAIDVVGLSYREAARALRVREATITTRLYRARQRLAQSLGNERSPSDGAIG